MEIVLVDDGSTDSSGEICDEYATHNATIRVFHTNNQGASLARRFGLEQAYGKYVTFVDSDDFVEPNYVSTLYDLLQQNGVSISACGVRRGRAMEDMRPETLVGETKVLEKNELLRRFFKYEFWGFWGGMYFRNSLINIDFPRSTVSEDYYVKAKLFQMEQRMAYTPAPLYHHEYHENSLSHQRLSKKAFEEFDNVKSVYAFVVKEMPDFAEYALSNVVETIMKLLRLTKSDISGDYADEKNILHTFLRTHRKEIVFCSPLNKKVKILAVLESMQLRYCRN